MLLFADLEAEMARQTGETTRQMEAAPQGAIFVWVNSRLDYTKALAKKLGRDDLEVVSPEWLSSDSWRGRTLTGVIVDHAASLTSTQMRGFDGACTRIR